MAHCTLGYLPLREDCGYAGDEASLVDVLFVAGLWWTVNLVPKMACSLCCEGWELPTKNENGGGISVNELRILKS